MQRLADRLAELQRHQVLLPELGRHPGGELLGIVLVQAEQDLGGGVAAERLGEVRGELG
jgi:hypothetical protein